MDPFASLGLPHRFELDREELEQRYRTLQRELHPDRHRNAPASQRRMTLVKAMEVNEAYRALRDEMSRATALLAFHGGGEAHEPDDPEFLMEIMELREALGEARAAADRGQITALQQQVAGKRAEQLASLAAGFAQLPEGEQVDPARLQALQSTLGRLRYFARFLDEVRVIEDDLD